VGNAYPDFSHSSVKCSERQEIGGQLFGKKPKMLWTVFLILMVSWALGLATLPALGGFIHLPLFFALMTLAIDVLQERRL
jgi:hypothetical protein